MLHIVRNNNPLTVLILSIYAIAANWQVLFNPQLPVVADGDFMFHIIANFLGVIFFNSAFGFTLLTVVMLILQALYLNGIANRHKLFGNPTYVVAFTYISLTSLYPHFGYFSSPLLYSWLLMMTLDNILWLAQSNKARKLIYNAGFTIGLAALISFPAVFFALLLFVALSLLRNFNGVEWIVGLLGIITPIYFAAGLLYLFDVLHWLPGWVHIGINLPRNITHPVYIVGVITGCIFLFSMGTYALQKSLSRVGLFVRRGWTTLAAGLLISVIVAVLTPFEIKAAWLCTMPVLSIIVANAYSREKRKAFSNFAFYFTLVLVIFSNIFGA